MIIKSHIRGGFRDAAAYLKAQGENEYTRLVKMSDPHVRTLDEAFKAMWAVSNGTKAKKPLHHVSINPMKDERLTDKQVRRICERLEEKYGYAHGEHQRVIVEHIKGGRQHFHVIWNRVNLKTGKPHYPYMHKKQSKIAAREIEVELGLKKPISKRKRSLSQFRKMAKKDARAGISGLSRPLAFSRQLKPHNKAIADIQPNIPHRRVDPQAPYRPAMLHLKAKTGSMCHEERIDFVAACEGRITWAQYFRKWGGNSAAPQT